QLPRQTGVLDRTQRRRAGSAVVAADVDDLGLPLGNAARDVADPRLCDELDGDFRLRRDAVKIVDQLREVFDRVDIVMRRRRDQALTRDRAAQRRDFDADLVTRNLTAFAGLAALRHL